MRLTDRDRRATRFLVVAGGAIIALVVLVMPLLDYWDALDKERADLEGKVRTIANNVNDQIEAQKLMGNLRDQATLFTARDQLNQQTAMLIRQVESLPGYRQLEVYRMEGLAVRPEDDFSRSGVSLQYAGTLQSLSGFLQAVEAQKPALKVERLTISTHQSDPTMIEGQMVLSGYAVVAEEKKG